MTDHGACFCIPPEADGKRLDSALAALLPATGLHARRRLCERGAVLVDGKSAPPAYKVRKGQILEVVSISRDPSPEEEKASVIRITDHLAFLQKPEGMHAAALQGAHDVSLEGLLPHLLPGFPDVRLLNRLDAPTAGIVVAALDAAGAEMYHAAQETGAAEKRYLAILAGELNHPVEIRRRILQDKRAKVRVLHEDDADPLRRTILFPLATFTPGGSAFLAHLQTRSGIQPPALLTERATLAGCIIFKGARHQIRAHAASIGFPLFGDAKYAASANAASCGGGNMEHFFLYHAMFSMPGLSVESLPPWLEALFSEEIISRDDVMRWLHSFLALRSA